MSESLRFFLIFLITFTYVIPAICYVVIVSRSIYEYFIVEKPYLKHIKQKYIGDVIFSFIDDVICGIGNIVPLFIVLATPIANLMLYDLCNIKNPFYKEENENE